MTMEMVQLEVKKSDETNANFTRAWKVGKIQWFW